MMCTREVPQVLMRGGGLSTHDRVPDSWFDVFERLDKADEYYYALSQSTEDEVRAELEHAVKGTE